jgi:hydrogenase maturation protease
VSQGRHAAITLVIGCGNPERADDGVGALAAGRLRASRLDGVAVIEDAGNPLDLIQRWEGCESLVLIDAAAPLSRPGQIHRIDLHRQELPPELAPPSTHGFGVAAAVELARALHRLPPRAVVYAVEGACFTPGAAMSAEVAAAADRVTQRVIVELQRSIRP